MALRDIVILAVVALSIPAALMRPWIGVMAWTWLGLMNPHRMAWGIAKNFPVAQGVALATLVGLLLTRDRKPPPATPEMVLLGLFMAHLTLTSALSWYPQIAWERWDTVFKIILFAFVASMLIHERWRVRYFVLVMVASVGFYGVKGGVFSILTGGNYMIWGPPNSFIGGNTSLGLAMCMILPLAFYAAKAEANRYVRWALYGVFALSIPAILFTYSRGAFVGLLVVMAAIFWRYKLHAVIVLAIAAASYGALIDYLPDAWVERQQSTLEYQEDYSAMQRIQAWGVAFNIALERPLTGAGFRFEYAGDTERWLSYANFVEPWASEERAAHSIYFQVLGQHGFLGLGLFLALLGWTVLRLHQLAGKDLPDEHRWIALYARGVEFSLLPFIVAGAFLSLAFFDLVYYYIALSAILRREYVVAMTSRTSSSPSIVGGPIQAAGEAK